MEGHLTMSKKERARLVVMAKVMKSEMKISEPYDGCEASELLGLSYRQTFRIAKRYGAEGAGGWCIEVAVGHRIGRGMRWCDPCEGQRGRFWNAIRKGMRVTACEARRLLWRNWRGTATG